MLQKPKFKNILAFFTFLPLGIAAQTQFSLQPIPSAGFGDVGASEVPVAATISNLSDTVLNLKWERLVISLTPGCSTGISDPYIGWAPFISSRNLDLMPNQAGPLNVNFYNNGAPCSGIVHLKISNRNNPLDTLIGVYLFNQSTGITNGKLAVPIRLYPNPATSFFSLDQSAELASVRVLSLDGRDILRFENQGGKPYAIGQLPPGNYVVVLEAKNGVPFQALELLKQ